MLQSGVHKGKITFVDVMPSMLAFVPSIAVQWINKALNEPLASCETYDYYSKKVADGAGNIVLVYRKNELLGVFTMMILLRPKANVLLIGPLGGKKFRLWHKEIFEFCKDFAHDNKCRYVLAHGRKGLSRFLPDAKIDGYIYACEV